MGVRDAQVADVPRMADLAEAKRQQYRDHAAPFQRPAPNGQAAGGRDGCDAGEPREGGFGVDAVVV